MFLSDFDDLHLMKVFGDYEPAESLIGAANGLSKIDYLFLRGPSQAIDSSAIRKDNIAAQPVDRPLEGESGSFLVPQAHDLRFLVCKTTLEEKSDESKRYFEAEWAMVSDL